MADLPLIPGFTFSDPTKLQRPIRQSLGWKKGAPLVAPTPTPLLSEEDLRDLTRKERQLQFSTRRRSKTPPKFLPDWAVLDKKVLRFRGYFTEHVEGGAAQVYRIRPVVICYYLVDDALYVTEPRTPNSGLDQGRLLSRQRVPHPDGGFWHWTHLNLGMTLSLYGRHFVICDCDPFTKEYLLSEGTQLNNPLPIPTDPYNLLRQSRAESPTRTSDLRPHSAPAVPLRFKGLVLKFDAMVEEVEGRQLRASPAVLLYRPADLTVEMRQPSYFDHTEIKKFSPIILRPVKVPLRDTRRAMFVDIGEEGEVREWLTPRHLIPPTTVTVFGRRVMVTGCDDQTQRFLLDHYGIDNVPPMKIIETTKPDESGSSGKTQSDIVPRPKPRPGLLHSENATVLRFSATLESPLETECDRSFIFTYHVIDDTLELTELVRPGGLGGRVLSRTRVPKPKVKGDEEGAGRYSGPDFYTLNDFYIGATLDTWGRRYTITGADRYVLNFVRQHEEKVSPQLLSSLVKFFGQEEARKEKTDEQN
ncbi:EF-hand domain-containing protein 1-like [Homarus americanus]|uniref:EF-hand domain-containing protein 1-like n=1 Tax=Homarus americanus TaxID=6706 RepID=UPI001C44E82E|nr:EF-hand domain-containing protein 1-like [Homarus americanus]XP_042233320.1 EF-hand domain-containing protein 1-like [Homarus americanus]